MLLYPANIQLASLNIQHFTKFLPCVVGHAYVGNVLVLYHRIVAVLDVSSFSYQHIVCIITYIQFTFKYNIYNVWTLLCIRTYYKEFLREALPKGAL